MLCVLFSSTLSVPLRGRLCWGRGLPHIPERLLELADVDALHARGGDPHLGEEQLGLSGSLSSFLSIEMQIKMKLR